VRTARLLHQIQRRLLLPLAVAAILGGCSVMEVKKDIVEKTAAIRKAPQSAPHRSITSFSAALRCMDGMLVDYGVRDVGVLVEDIVDQTKKVNAGTKDMLISAVSEMTRRSRAIRLVAFGQDANNAIAFVQQAGSKSIYEIVPQFDVKGSITQLDENLIRNQKDLGFAVREYLNLGVSRDAASNLIGLDLTVLRTSDLSVVAGVTSRNSVILFKEGRGVDGDATIKKLGITFNMNLSKSEGQAQALRNLVELASIELVGRLTRTPYWLCLGSSPDHEEVRLEISDWYFAMASNPVELVQYFQWQFRRRGVYDGPIDGVLTDALREALSRYREALGMTREPKPSLEFFEAYLRADHRALRERIAATGPRAPAPGEPPAAAAARDPATPLALKVNARSAQKSRRGEAVQVVVRPNRDAHVYCYLRDEHARIMRFYPNRFTRDALVTSAHPLELPGAQRFRISASVTGVHETIACFATERDVMGMLPPAVIGMDFEALALTSLEQVRAGFAAATKRNFAEAYFNVETR
jgi:hypothetical protein